MERLQAVFSRVLTAHLNPAAAALHAAPATRAILACIEKQPAAVIGAGTFLDTLHII
jgi:hypothetical protein